VLESRVSCDQGMGCHLACALQHERQQSVAAKLCTSPAGAQAIGVKACAS
jgi:hypothetical protein